MDIKELRKLGLEQLLVLMHELGLSTEGIKERTAALTKLMGTAVEA